MKTRILALVLFYYGKEKDIFTGLGPSYKNGLLLINDVNRPNSNFVDLVFVGIKNNK